MKIPEQSPWVSEPKTKNYPKLEQNLTVDVAIIGGGLAGINTAYHLTKSGLKVAVLEKDQIGSGATGYTTAMITQIIDTSLTDLKDIYGLEKAKEIVKAKRQSVDMIAQVVEDEKLDCEFMRCSNYMYAADEKQTQELKEEYNVSKEFGIEGEYSEEKELGFKHFGVWEVKNQAKFHPLKFLFNLAQKTESLGAKIFENTEAEKIEEQKDGLLIQTKSGQTVQAKYSIMCTYVPFDNPIQTLFKKGMYVTYEFGLTLPKGLLKPAIYEDLNNPYYYFRVDEGEESDTMLIGGEDHRQELKIDPEKNYRSLQNYIETMFPKKNYKIIKRWSGPILEPSDGLALIGEYKPNQMIATAFSGNGMTYSMLSALIFKDIITDNTNPAIELFDPKRIPGVYQLYIKGRDYIGTLMGGAVDKIINPPK
jgi:glycine/D-amino acid oxidase-like deaminating enzyme